MDPHDSVTALGIDEVLFEEFGVNARYVGDLFQRFQHDPFSVDEDWQTFFAGLLRREEVAALARGEIVKIDTAGGASLGPGMNGTSPPIKSEPPLPATVLSRGMDNGPATAIPGRTALRGAALRIVENMEASLGVPTATSQRQIPIKLLDENRRLINQYLETTGGKVSYTHLIIRALLKALKHFPQLNDSHEEIDGVSYRVQHPDLHLGIAVDVMRRDGTHTLVVPNMKSAQRLSFPELIRTYDDIIKRAREGKLEVADFQGTTVSLTNPGTLGTTVSNPRLMAGQGLIVATGAIEFPPEYLAMTPDAISWLGISKVITLTSTYDHRIIQGAESGAFLAFVDELLRGQHSFYDEIFSELRIPYRPYHWAVDLNPAILGEQRHRDEVKKQARVLELINAYRVRGHLIADIDPLGWREMRYHPELDIETYGLTIWDLDRQFITTGLGGTETAPLREVVTRLRRFYGGKVGIEYRHIQSPEEKEWIRARVENDPPPIPTEVKQQILWKLISAEQFERFLATKYPGQKRYSIQGAEVIVALLDQLIESAARFHIQDLTIGMSHRGRLNVIANVIGRFCERIFTDFEGSVHPRFPHDQHDVKYHRGASGVRETVCGHPVSLTVLPNPSHLEFVDPVVEGIVRAKQDLKIGSAPDSMGSHDPARDQVLAVLVHGDAAFVGEGIVAETLNLSQLPGYSTQGTIHFIVNNQLGFTTPPEEGRSSTYSSDVARMVQAPIFHVNGDDPEAACHVLQIALEYRQEFHKDVVIDVVGFRREGHNEGDEPTYTQPVMYRLIRTHPGVRQLYADKLIGEGIYDEAKVASLIEERMLRYENALLGAKEIVARHLGSPQLREGGETTEPEAAPATGVDQATLREIARVATTVPAGFIVNPKIVGLLARRAKMVEGERAVDWGMAETLAFGSLLLEGTAVRMAGQDTVRGTFSQRHATLYDTQTGAPWTPLEGASKEPARFRVFDSPLSEASALGFEYGYSVAAPQTLVLWEAQFGDFVNAAQVIVDQFVAAGEDKWNQTSRVVMLLPHGYEGQGPEHSSARIERFLQLCAQGNLQVVCCTTAAQYFHLLRRQARQKLSKPLIVFTPKSLLRFPEASSPIEEFTHDGFQPILKEGSGAPQPDVERVMICSGKVYFELHAERGRLGNQKTAILRLEQFYPFPRALMAAYLGAYPRASEIRWVQEEPQNMGGWGFVENYLRILLRSEQSLRYVGRAAGASTATGSHTVHQMEQQKIVAEAFA
ncbi:MAG: multifunctional oxoglutarate decarboxylase/oxoglutarate dehydrogenase thiamine pyrophosphate-binding subunit/dihydrolipoyllysine-residue succinyltransferase subunit [Acidobacteriia bacterium]|nr:multifunctional oxoglutarate decarboxylase/oxoglutarate dehydrogenase thiamine pyrophosphate-binding subunit/dihydrolipoyllysine-residue succinyltransferase subunit [Terriglobia bacterium]